MWFIGLFVSMNRKGRKERKECHREITESAGASQSALVETYEVVSRSQDGAAST